MHFFLSFSIEVVGVLYAHVSYMMSNTVPFDLFLDADAKKYQDTK